MVALRPLCAEKLCSEAALQMHYSKTRATHNELVECGKATAEHHCRPLTVVPAPAGGEPPGVGPRNLGLRE